ncbi:molybdopterin dinucleotide binding domain-containing protein [Sedimentibacter sp. MB31-C6]|uniref:molybdopterin dinucleotide binding domain-containing protein n=1 Tax=Sedimentibacter sp. MB31-C6 TaxID=3109366 RepID=UPI002DDCDDBB|nr:molybdopterin dinucleotide binding domain-containing protein [Sedimentibacter sp. MB36-C1]WSI05575.1 molybdopterin dinucleotide binding domain-containing protein [Sedimentibacter sp. MB36-C1]
MNNAEYVLFMGAFPGHSGKPMQAIARQSAKALNDGNVKITVVDPVMVGGAVNPLLKNSKWVPIVPTTDGAFGMAMIQYIIDNKKYDEKYLSSPNLEAAKEKGYNSWSNASHLVIVDESHKNYGKMLRAEDVGFIVPEDEKEPFMTIDKATGDAKFIKDVKEADIHFVGAVKGIKVKTAFVILKETADEHTLDEYAADCGIDKNTIIEIADDFTSHGMKSSVDTLGGTATSNGLDLAFIVNVLSTFVGSMNKKGGIFPRRYSYKGLTDGARYKLSTIEGKPANKALSLSRAGVSYESTDEYKLKVAKGDNPYPSRLPWHPVGSGSDNQMIFSMINKYPYSVKIFMNWMANPLLALPAAARKEVIETLKSPETVPLFISVDCYMGETTALADYIVPDTTPYESWGLANVEGNFSGKATTLRWPVVEPASMKLDDGRHASYEVFLVDVAKAIGVPGFGKDAITDVDGNKYDFNDAHEFYLKGVANLAYDGEAVDDISDEEIEMQDLETATSNWKDALGSEEEWKKVMNLLSRGGRFEDHGAGFDGDNRVFANTKCFSLYNEKLATSYNSITGEKFAYGTPAWNPQRFFNGELVSDVFAKEEWPFKAANYKPKFRSVSMLANSSSLKDINLGNKVEMNSEDAKALGISTGDKVKVTPATGGEFEGTALVREGIAKGTIGVAYGYGHWEYGAKSFTIEGKEQSDAERGHGFHLIGITDPSIEGIFGFSEVSTGGPSRNGGAYKVEKL